MLISALGSIGDRLDTKFAAAYFVPAFVAVLGTIAIVARQAGETRFIDWVDQFDAIQQGVLVFALLLSAVLAAQLLRALALPIGDLFTGRAYPDVIRRLLRPVQARARAHALSGRRMVERGDRLFPHDRADLEPTAFGNVVAAAADYPQLVYGMDPYYWWPRLIPLCCRWNTRIPCGRWKRRCERC